MILKKEEKELISLEIAELEKLSSAEIVAVITQKSSNYKYAALMLSIFCVFLMSFILYFIKEISTLELLQYQLLVFLGINLFLKKFNHLVINFVPKSYKHQKASLNAKRQFNIRGLDKTKNKQAIMFFVSLDEKYVKIMTDKEISEKIPNEFWQQLIFEFTEDVKREDFVNGYIKAIKTSKAILIKHFPIQENDENELSNEVIELR